MKMHAITSWEEGTDVQQFSSQMEIMKPLMQNYAMWFNQRYGYVGHVFDSRYTSCLWYSKKYDREVIMCSESINRILLLKF